MSDALGSKKPLVTMGAGSQFGIAGFEHVPVDELHVPAVWQISSGVQTTELPAVHAPLWHVSFRSQRLPSLHAVPFGATGFKQTPVEGAHAPMRWH
jgi:hypothetical protein